MTTRKEPWPDGVPGWVDLMVPDRHVAREFYRALFGWEFDESGPETGYYATCRLGGRAVAGIGQSPADQPGPPPVWTTYLATASADDAATAVTAAGGQVIMPPMDVMEYGRMAVAADPTGAAFGLWQSGTHTGAELVNEPGSVTWNEVLTTDVEAAKAFYAAAFGYGYEDMDAPGVTYATIQLGGQPVGGIGAMPPYVPAGTPPHWLTYFATVDTDRTCATAVAGGGVVHGEPWNTPFGRLAVLGGPAGETFAVMGTGG